MKWAKNEYDKFQINPDYEVSEEELISFLKPTGVRVGENFPHLLKEHTGYNTMEGFDDAQLNTIVESLNKNIIEILSTQLGVLSLCKSDNNKLMWDRYASEGKGLAISFKENHPFFTQYAPTDVRYTKEERASFTYFEGCCRVNGVPIEDFYVQDLCDSNDIVSKLFAKGIDFEDLTRRLIFSKSEEWVHEEETRVVCPLNLCEESSGKKITPQLNVKITEDKLKLFQSYSEIYLKKIPFDAFDSLILGFDISDENKQSVIDLLNTNPELSHVKIKVARHNIFGDIEVVSI